MKIEDEVPTTMPNNMTQAKPEYRFATEQCQRQAGEEHCHRRPKGSVQGLVDREIDQIAQRQRFVFAEILPHSVIHHDLVVSGVAQDRQNGGNHDKVELDPRESKEPYGLGYVENEGDDGANRKLPLKPEPDVDEYHYQANTQGEQAIAEQFCRDRCSDRIGPQHLHPRYRLFQGSAHPGYRLLHRGLRGLGAQPDEHLRGVAELLHPLLGKVLGRQSRADLTEIGGPGQPHFHHDAAREIDPQVQPGVEEQHHRSR